MIFATRGSEIYELRDGATFIPEQCYVKFTDHQQELERMRGLLREYRACCKCPTTFFICDLCKRTDAILEEPK